MNIHSIIVTILVCLVCTIILAFLIVGVIFLYKEKGSVNITYEKCCGGYQCSDTYYDVEHDRCVLSLCENSMFTNKQDCYYKPT